MKILNDKIVTSPLPPADWNEQPTELQNIITQSGQTPTSSDLNQVGKGIADYVANNNFYIDTGVANAYVVGQVDGKQNVQSYINGMGVVFIAGNSNTGASTINVLGLGVKAISNAATPGVIVAGGYVHLRYNSVTDNFAISLGSTASKNIGFKVSRTSQLSGHSANVDIPFDDVIYNPDNFFKTSTNRFLPSLAGKYLVQFKLSITGVNAGTFYAAYLILNGSTLQSMSSEIFGGSNNSNKLIAITTVDMNGTTDYISCQLGISSNFLIGADVEFFATYLGT